MSKESSWLQRCDLAEIEILEILEDVTEILTDDLLFDRGVDSAVVRELSSKFLV